MTKEELLQELNKINLTLTEEQFSNLDIFCNYLILFNEHTNLTAIKDKESIYLKHIYDSLTLTKVVEFNQIKSVLDIGTGPGFPGLILKIIFPHLQMTLLDSNNKKTKFLNSVITKLKLENVIVINDRAENYIKNKRESYDLVTSRAVARLNILAELSLPYVKVNGLFIAMKGINNKIESNEGITAGQILGAKLQKTYITELPKEKSARTLYIFLKEIETPTQYPRRYEQIKKNPLKIVAK